MPRITLTGKPAPSPPLATGGFALIAGTIGPQIALMETAGMLTVSVDRGEEVRLAVPVKNFKEPVRILADIRGTECTEAEVELTLSGKRYSRKSTATKR